MTYEQYLERHENLNDHRTRCANSVCGAILGYYEGNHEELVQKYLHKWLAYDRAIMCLARMPVDGVQSVYIEL